MPSEALLGLDRVKMTVSFASSKESSTILAIVMVPDDYPALIVRVPSAKV